MNTETIISSYYELIEKAGSFLNEIQPNRRTGDIRLKDGLIEEYVNTSCHCHPEYDWIGQASIESFDEWLSKKT